MAHDVQYYLDKKILGIRAGTLLFYIVTAFIIYQILQAKGLV